MPGRGNSFGLFPDMDEEEHLVLNIKVPLIQLVYPKPVFFDQQLHNYFDVKVEDPAPGQRNSRLNVKWFTGGDAKVLFKVKNRKTGLAVAWVPDDPWMHNRLLLMTHPEHEKLIKQLRRPDGNIVAPAEISFELRAMESVLMCSTPIYHVLCDKERKCWFPSKAEAEAFADDQGRTEVKLDKDGTFKPMKVNKQRWSVEPGERMLWKPEVLAMIQREHNKHRFGWTECDEFKAKWRKLIIKTISDQRDQFSEANQREDAKDVVSAFENLPDEAIEALFRRMQARKQAKKSKKPAKQVEEVAE